MYVCLNMYMYVWIVYVCSVYVYIVCLYGVCVMYVVCKRYYTIGITIIVFITFSL